MVQPNSFGSGSNVDEDLVVGAHFNRSLGGRDLKSRLGGHIASAELTVARYAPLIRLRLNLIHNFGHVVLHRAANALSRVQFLRPRHVIAVASRSVRMG